MVVRPGCGGRGTVGHWQGASVALAEQGVGRALYT